MQYILSSRSFSESLHAICCEKFFKILTEIERLPGNQDEAALLRMMEMKSEWFWA